MTGNSMAMLALVCGLLTAGGIVGAIAVWRGWSPRPRTARLRRQQQRAFEELPARWRDHYRWLLTAAAAAGILMWAWTGWPVHGLITAGAVAGFPYIWHPGGSAQARITRLDALAEWLRQLAGVHVAGVPLEQTIQASVPNVPVVLRRPVAVLAERLRAGYPPHLAYREFADHLADGTSDDVVLMFMDHADNRGPGMARALEKTAAKVAQKVIDAQAVDAERAKVRTNARTVSVFTLAVVAVSMLSTDYTAPYGTLGGQILLIALSALFVGALRWMRRMARPRPEPRLLLPAGHRTRQPGGIR
ncbi:type II secretion system F family protein [Streptomyces sp. NPDC007875]|uniref:type II secretion system F family protein n=1 Tax=Streptomyces sp. NPDC007875 TaxID=3364783 RepID=UPI00367DC159